MSIVGFGNFDAAGGMYVLWSNGSQPRVWSSTGNAAYAVYPVGSYSPSIIGGYNCCWVPEGGLR